MTFAKAMDDLRDGLTKFLETLLDSIAPDWRWRTYLLWLKYEALENIYRFIDQEYEAAIQQLWKSEAADAG